MTYRDTGWSAPYFDKTNRKIGHFKLSIADYSQNGCDAEFEDCLSHKIIQKAFLDDPYGEGQKSSQQKAEEWLMSLVPKELIDPNKPSFWERAIRPRRGLMGYSKAPKPPIAHDIPSGAYRKEFCGYKSEVLHYCKHATTTEEMNCPQHVLAEAIKCGLCLPGATSMFQLSPLGRRVSILVNEIDGKDASWAVVPLRKERSLWVLRAVFAYAVCKNWRTSLKVAIMDRIVDIERQLPSRRESQVGA